MWAAGSYKAVTTPIGDYYKTIVILPADEMSGIFTSGSETIKYAPNVQETPGKNLICLRKIITKYLRAF